MINYLAAKPLVPSSFCPFLRYSAWCLYSLCACVNNLFFFPFFLSYSVRIHKDHQGLHSTLTPLFLSFLPAVLRLCRESGHHSLGISRSVGGSGCASVRASERSFVRAYDLLFLSLALPFCNSSRMYVCVCLYT